jgi:hypothetical protein
MAFQNRFPVRSFLILSLLAVPASALADCFTDCMGSCWSSRSDENVSYCSGTEARCESQCRHDGSNQRSYGAIAYSKTDGAYGYSDDWGSRKKAEATALDACRENGPGCEVIVWFFDSCAAVAGSADIVGWGQDVQESRAKKKALEACTRDGGTACTLKVWHCSK